MTGFFVLATKLSNISFWCSALANILLAKAFCTNVWAGFCCTSWGQLTYSQWTNDIFCLINILRAKPPQMLFFIQRTKFHQQIITIWVLFYQLFARNKIYARLLSVMFICEYPSIIFCWRWQFSIPTCVYCHANICFVV